MPRHIELGINPAEFFRNQEREVMNRAWTERVRLLGGVSQRVFDTLTEKIVPLAKKTLVLGLRHSWVIGSVVEVAELAANQNLLTGQELSRNERGLRYMGASFEGLALALAAYAGHKEIGHLLSAMGDAAVHHQFHNLYQSLGELKHLTRVNPEMHGALALELVSGHAGYAQELVTLGKLLKNIGDKAGFPKIGEALSKMYQMLRSAAKTSYGT